MVLGRYEPDGAIKAGWFALEEATPVEEARRTDQPVAIARGERSESMTPNITEADREIVITRMLDAPRELVWKALTDPEHLIRWWGPRGFTSTFHEIDVRPGGVWRFIMHGPDGVDYGNHIVFEEVVAPERLAYQHGTDEEPGQFQGTITLADRDGRTELTLRTLFASSEDREFAVREIGAIEGGNSTLDRLEEHLATMR